MFDQLHGWEKIGIVVILMGSVVDIFQFTWIIKRWLGAAKKGLEDRVRKQILLEQLNNHELHRPKDEFPGGLHGQKDR